LVWASHLLRNSKEKSSVRRFGANGGAAGKTKAEHDPWGREAKGTKPKGDGSLGRGKAGVGDCSLTTVDNQMGLTIDCCTIIIQRERGTTILGTAGKAGQSKANIYGDRIGCSWRLYPSQSALMILTCCRAARPPACDCPQGGGSSVLCAGVVCLVFASQ
jgi:hypothetical protein